MNEKLKLVLGVLQRELDEERRLEYDHLFHGNKWHLLHQCDYRHNICYFQCLDLDDQGDDPVMELLLRHVLEEDVGPLGVELEMDDNSHMLQLVLQWVGVHDDSHMLQLVLRWVGVHDDSHMLQLALRWVGVHDDSHMLQLALQLAEVHDDGVQRAMNALEMETYYNVHGCMDFDDNSQDNHYLVWILPLLIVPVLALFETLLQIGQKLVVQL